MEACLTTCHFCLAGNEQSTGHFMEFHGISDLLTLPQIPPSFMVRQDLVPLGDAHMLLLPLRVAEKHSISLATIPNSGELVFAHETLLSIIASQFPGKTIFMFEHGAGVIRGTQIACGGCHMDHAHGHYIVLPPDVTLEAIKQHASAILRRSGWKDLEMHTLDGKNMYVGLSEIVGTYPYLHFGLFSNGEQKSITFVQTREDHLVESQLFRRVIAEAVFDQYGPTFWNWRDVSDGLTSQDRINTIHTVVYDVNRRLK